MVVVVFRVYLLFTGFPMPGMLGGTVLDLLVLLLDRVESVLVAVAAVASIIFAVPTPLSHAETLCVMQALWGF
eukprot:5841568-Heterocapsa_arctica.AAC.1